MPSQVYSSCTRPISSIRSGQRELLLNGNSLKLVLLDNLKTKPLSVVLELFQSLSGSYCFWLGQRVVLVHSQ